MMDYEFFDLKNRLKLNDWDDNNVLSPDMKKLFNLFINKIDQQESQLSLLRNDVAYLQHEVMITTKYLNNKTLNNEYQAFKDFLIEKPFSTDTDIKAFFRKQKIKKILELDEEFQNLN